MGFYTYVLFPMIGIQSYDTYVVQLKDRHSQITVTLLLVGRVSTTSHENPKNQNLLLEDIIES